MQQINVIFMLMMYMPCQKTVVMIDNIKSKNSVPTNLTPVTIMVVDTISAVRSRKLLRVLLDSVIGHGDPTIAKRRD